MKRVAHRRLLLWLLGLHLPLFAATPARSQTRHYSPEEERWLEANWVDDVNFAAANALLSGIVTGAFTALHEDGSFADGFLRGAAGGAVVYAGKRLAAERFPGAGLLGRQVAGVGVSIARNAREGRGALDEVVFAVGPARLYWDRANGDVAFRPDIMTLYWMTRGFLESRLEVDWSRSASSGAPVFVTRRAELEDAAGQMWDGIILLDTHTTLPLDDVFAHERVHVIQRDHHFGLWGEPLERWGVGWLGNRVASLAGRVDVGWATSLLTWTAKDLLVRGANPFEIEADYLEVR